MKKYICALLLALGGLGAGEAGAAIDARSQPVSVGVNVTSKTWSHITTGTNRAMLVCGAYLDSETPTWTATYNGVDMGAPIWHKRSSVDNQGTVAFRMAAPATGTHDIVISAGATVISTLTGFAVTATGVDQTTVTRTAVTGNDTGSGAISQTVTSVADDLVVDCITSFGGTITVGSGQDSSGTEDDAIGGGGRSAGLSTEAATGTSTVMSWAGNATWAGGAVAFIGGGTGVPPTACTGSSPSLVAASTEQTAMQNCYDLAVSGDTVTVPVGTATWVNPVFNKNVTLVCATPPTCVITGVFTSTGTTAARISGFTWNIGMAGHLFDRSQGFRFDNNVVNATAGNTIAIQVWGSTATPSEGLIDHNTLTNVRILAYGEVLPGVSTGLPKGNPRWSEPENMGTVHAVYVEDNVFNVTCPGVTCSYPNNFDGAAGNRIVARFNTLNSGRIEVHGVQTYNIRAQRLWEFYNNSINSSLGANYRPFLIRGGTGVIFHNDYDGLFSGTHTIDIDGPRQENVGILAGLGAWGMCDGASPIDENTATFEGWHCLDQIGTSTDASLWAGGVTTRPPQARTPARMWKNTNTNTVAEMAVVQNCALADAYCTRQGTKQILPDRDYYIYSALTASTQTTGIREGTLATMAGVTTCTQGVAFWATNGGGNWNTSASNPYGVNAAGADGALYVCGASNNWVLTYTPYTYPHPLQGAASPPGPAALAAGTHMANFQGSTFAVVIWPVSTDVDHAAYNIYRCTQPGACTNLVKRLTRAESAAAHSPETRWVDATLYTAGTYYYCVADENTMGYIGTCSTPSGVTVTGKQ